MPRGLPTNIASTVQEQLTLAIEYFEIPEWQQVLTTSQSAYHDSITALRSTGTFFQVVLKPFYILLALIGTHLYAVLKVLAEHSCSNFIKGGREGIRQGVVALKWLVRYQRSLSQTAIWMEAGFVVALVGMYSLRRYIQKKKYVARLMKWYTRKKKAVTMYYENMVERVSQTSLVLALLLPHFLYVTTMALLKYFVPNVVNYISAKTILSDVISFYHPLFRTLLAVHRWRGLSLNTRSRGGTESYVANTAGSGKQQKDDTIQNQSASSFITTRTTSSILNTLVGKKSKVSDRYLKAAKNTRNTSNDSSSSPTSSAAQNLKTPQIPEANINQRNLEDMEQAVQELSKLIQYWIVYALLCAIYQTCALLPIAGSILSSVTTTPSSATIKRTYPWTRKGSTAWLGKIKPSKEFLYECQLFFYIWLLYLPTLQEEKQVFRGKDPNGDTSKANDGKVDVRSKVRGFEIRAGRISKRRKSKQAPFPTKPLEIFYDKLTPLAISLLASSTNLIQTKVGGAGSKTSVGDDSSEVGRQTMVLKSIAWSRSFLDVMVWTKLISEKTKNRVVSTLIECSALLPALVTLGMPSYFTQYGIIYISLIVPAASAANANNMLFHIIEDHDISKVTSSGTRVNRYLQYWIIYAIMSSVLSSFAPVLSWIPLSTHLTWLSWAYIQLEATTSWIYDVVEWDLMAFGMLHRHTRHDEKSLQSRGAHDAITMKLLNSILTKMPSAQQGIVKDQELSSSKEDIQESLATTKIDSVLQVPATIQEDHKNHEEKTALMGSQLATPTAKDEDAPCKSTSTYSTDEVVGNSTTRIHEQ